MLHKSGSSKECSNYRMIALISHASKILLMILLNRMKTKMNEVLSEEQAGFRKDRRTNNMLVAPQVLIEEISGSSEVSVVIFIDYSKAFDSISHVQLFTVMLHVGLPKHLVALLQSLYSDQSVIVKWNGNHTQPFNIGKGVRQGCICSPTLFNIYSEQVMRDANTEDYGINIGG